MIKKTKHYRISFEFTMFSTSYIRMQYYQHLQEMLNLNGITLKASRCTSNSQIQAPHFLFLSLFLFSFRLRSHMSDNFMTDIYSIV